MPSQNKIFNVEFNMKLNVVFQTGKICRIIPILIIKSRTLFSNKLAEYQLGKDWDMFSIPRIGKCSRTDIKTVYFATFESVADIGE